jgi:DNA-directed RNA polymerase specialized sigma24 family protein
VIGTPIEDLALAGHDSGVAPEAAFEATEVLEAISRLPDNFRMALIAVDLVGLTYGEAAKALGTREATITSRLYRARQQLSRTLSVQTARNTDD